MAAQGPGLTVGFGAFTRIFGRPRVAAATTAMPLGRLSQRYGYRLQNSRYASSPQPGQTIASLLHLEAEPCWVRLLYCNDQPDPWTLDAAAVASTAAEGDGVTPVGIDGCPVPDAFARLTFGSGGADAPLALDPDRAATSLTVPGNPREDGCPVHAWSDWHPLAARPRRDGAAGFLLLARSYAGGTMRFAGSVGGPDPALGRLHAGFVATGDGTGGSTLAFARDDRLFACHGLQFIAPTPGATVLGVGDSIIHSSCTTGEMSGYAARACALLSRPDRPVSYVNEGFPGRNSLGFASTGLWAVEAFRPQVAIIQAWTRNEPWTDEMAALAFARAMAVAEATRAHGGVPVLTTAAPSFGAQPEGEPARVASNARVRALGRSGWPILDVDAVWGTGATPNLWRPDYDAGDGWHPNDRASFAAALVLAPLLERLLPQA